MNNLLPGIILGFREGLEAFLIVAIIIRYLGKINQNGLKKNVFYGTFIGIILSVVFGGALYFVSNIFEGADNITTIWESVSSIIALSLVTTFIIWMIKNGSHIAEHIEGSAAANLSKTGLMLISALMVAREGAEIVIFTFAGKYTLFSISIGIILSLLLSLLISFSLLKVKIKTIFTITLGYLILQAGFLLGAGIHEGIEVLNDLGFIADGSLILSKAFDLSSTIFYHKEGILGLPLYVLFGWYSKPEWLQFIAQYAYTIAMLTFWCKTNKKNV